MNSKARPLATVYSLAEYQLVEGESAKDDLKEAFGAWSLREREGQEDILGSTLGPGNVGCSSCGISSFEDAGKQREHVKCDWHRYNVKMRVLGRSIVSEDEFYAMVEEDDVGSISGSEDGSDDYDVRAGMIDAYSSDEEYDGAGSREDAALAPYCIFQVLMEGSSDPQLVGFWKCLSLADTRSKQTPITSAMYNQVSSSMKSPQHWAVVMLQGGHFVAAIYEVACPSDRVLHDDKKTLGEITDLCMNEVQHKSFHRYVVRAKAGGKQSDKDATGKFAKSAGSRLRRHNEAVLRQEILDTLAEWKPILDRCSMIFTSCPGSNKLVLFDKESTLVKTDPRLRRIPFVVRRPTVSETKRVVKTLLTVYSLNKGEDEQAEAQRRKEERVAKETAQAERLRQAEEQREAAKRELQRQEEINKARNKEKKQRQKERRKLENQRALQAREATAAEQTEDESVDAQLKLLAAAVGTKSKKAVAKSKPKPSQPKARASSKPEDLAARRQKLAEAAEKRAAALAAASSSQKFY